MRFTSYVITTDPIRNGTRWTGWAQMYSNGSKTEMSGDTKVPNNVFNPSDKPMFEDLTCTTTYWSSNVFKPAFRWYSLKQGCGPEKINKLIFNKGENGGWRKYYNSKAINKEALDCNPFWTNMDNTYFSLPSYKWGDDLDNLEYKVSCSAARDFSTSYSYVKLKADEPIIVKVGFNMFEADQKNA